VYQLLYYWGVISKKTDNFLKSFKNNNDDNNITCKYILINNNDITENTYDIHKNITINYDFVIITNSKNESIICFENFEEIKNKYLNGEDIFKQSNYEFLSYYVTLNEKQYEIYLKDHNYNFLQVENNIGNSTFIYWYLLDKYKLELPNINDFKENNNLWNISLIDSDADLKENITCNSIILYENNYKINN
tara:strand:+ start:83 stop:655 length:573 start_codon:yes stop_codon:yes gene_type:complete